MNKGYQLDREYSIGEIIRYNLRMWWLALICAAVCAAALGGYKLISLYPYLEKESYENIQQVTASLFIKEYNGESTIERANNVIKIADSYRAYETVVETTGYQIDYKTYELLFDAMQGEAGDVVSIYVTYPVNTGMFNMADEATAEAFINAVIEATARISKEVIGKDCFSVLDAPYLTSELQEVQSYFITQEDFKKGVLKAIVAGILLGIIVEVVIFTFWMLLGKKPKNTEEIRECLQVPVIDSLKEKSENEEETFKKIALFLRGKGTGGEAEEQCLSVSCMTAQCPKKDVALKLAMSYANEQKKTLFVDLTAGKEVQGAEHSISRYILGDAKMPKPNTLNNYLDTVCRSASEEKSFNVVMNDRFTEYLAAMKKEYDCIVVNSSDVSKRADAYAVSKLCDKTFIVCGRKTVTNETLYRVKNTAMVNDIHIEGVLVYEL